jgi:Ca2+-binding RTX toxin-like protein
MSFRRAPIGGIDTVFTSVNFKLSANVENAVLLEGGLTVTGNDLNNHITGSDLADIINGGKGGDTLRGFNGADLLNGDDGNDVIEGGSAPM